MTKAIQPIVNVTDIDNSGFTLASNAKPTTLADIEKGHIIPVFARDNMPTISQAEFMGLALDIARDTFGETHQALNVSVSHAVKGRTFEARHKKASELAPHERTIYYERLAFLAEFPIRQELNGQELSLTVAGIKAYNRDNLATSHDRTDQRFQVAVGFKVQVCTNMCVWSDGAKLDMRVRSSEELERKIKELFSGYNDTAQIEAMRSMADYELTEQQFANVIGRARMYGHLPRAQRNEIPELVISDTQFNNVAQHYLTDKNFSADGGKINMWNFYNLMTHAVKTSYLDNLLERNVNAFSISEGLMGAIAGNEDSAYNWFLN